MFFFRGVVLISGVASGERMLICYVSWAVVVFVAVAYFRHGMDTVASQATSLTDHPLHAGNEFINNKGKYLKFGLCVYRSLPARGSFDKENLPSYLRCHK